MVKTLLKYHVSTKSYLILKFRNVVKFYVHIRPFFSCWVTYKRGDVWGSEVQTCLHGCSDLVAAEAQMNYIGSCGGLTTGRLQWIYNMHKCAGIHNAIHMTAITNSEHRTSKQHINLQLGTSRSNRDFRDLNKIQEWFNQHEPFNLNEPLYYQA